MRYNEKRVFDSSFPSITKKPAYETVNHVGPGKHLVTVLFIPHHTKLFFIDNPSTIYIANYVLAQAYANPQCPYLTLTSSNLIHPAHFM